MSRQHDREPLEAERKATKPKTATPPLASQEAGEDDLRSSVGNSRMGRLLDPTVTDTIESELGGGRPFSARPGAQRAPEGSAQNVRIHDDGTAADLSRELGAVAFTFGRDIFLSGDAPSLESSDGQAMLRHELTHVDQQAAHGTTRPRRVSSPDSPAEQQASRAQHNGGGGSAAASANSVHRQGEDEEEELAMMSADTVHRQGEDEEEELAMMSADTVHRQVAEDELSDEEQVSQQASAAVGPSSQDDADAPAPANPALAALFEATVLAKHRAAIAALEATPANSQAAYDAVEDAWAGISTLSNVYEGNDPLLFAQLRRYQNGLHIMSEQLSAILFGPRSTDEVHAYLAHPDLVGLGEQLRTQLH